MRNDLIILEFCNDAGDPVIHPRIVASIGETLEAALSSVMMNVDSGHAISVMLSAADRGSLRLAFRAFQAGIDSEDTARRIGLVADGLSALGVGIAGLVWAANQLGLMTPEQPGSAPESMRVIELGERVASKGQERQNIERFVIAVTASNVDQVIIRVAGAPSCRVGKSPDADSALLGRLAGTQVADSPFSGQVRLQDASFRAKVAGSNGESATEVLHSGVADVPDGKLPVVVLWRSARPVPTYKHDKVVVSGKIARFDTYNIEPLEGVPSWARQAAGVLIVDTQTVSE